MGETAESYEVISGKFEVDEDLPKEKKERLQKYLDEEKYTTIVEVDLKDGVEITEAKNKLESESIIEDVDYNYEMINTGYAVQKAKYLGLRSESITLKSVTQTSAGNAKINWSELYNAEGYCISRSTSANGTYSRIAVVDDLSYVDKSVKKGKTYYYRVRGYMYYGYGTGTVNGNNAGYSTYSGVKSIKIK